MRSPLRWGLALALASWTTAAGAQQPAVPEELEAEAPAPSLELGATQAAADAVAAAERRRAAVPEGSLGPWWVDVEPTRATLVYQSPTSARVRFSSDAGILEAASAAGPDGDKLHVVTIDELEPDRRYALTVEHAVEGAEPARFDATIRTPPLGGDWSLLVYGDDRTGHDVHRRVVATMHAHEDVHGVLHTGDFVEVGGRPEDWRTYFEIAQPLLRHRALYPSLGNHEIYGPGGRRRFHRFLMPARREAYSAWTSGPVRVVSVDSNDEFRTDAQVGWLREELATARDHEGVRFVVVVLHHGPVSSGRHGGHPRFVDAGVDALLREHRVDLVLSGHDHDYERGDDRGLAYVVTGGGGAPLYDVNRHHPAQQAFAVRHHFLRLDFEGDAIRLTAFGDDGEAFERCDRVSGEWRCELEVGIEEGSAPPLGWRVWTAIVAGLLFVAFLVWRIRRR